MLLPHRFARENHRWCNGSGVQLCVPPCRVELGHQTRCTSDGCPPGPSARCPGVVPGDGLARALTGLSERVGRAAGADLGAMHHRLMLDTLTRTLLPLDARHPEQGVLVLTGDIPAMWLRDSSAQLRPWLALAEDPQLTGLLRGVVRLQWQLIGHDPWANAFTDPRRRWLPAGGTRHLLDDHVWRWRRTPSGWRLGDRWVWERKYEVDSLALPVQLAEQLWQATGDPSHLDEQVHAGCRTVVGLWRAEQHHDHSSYRFRRPFGSLPRGGRGAPVAHTGMTWQGFRPSDDRVAFGYNIPGNLAAAAALRRIAAFAAHWGDDPLADEALALRTDLLAGVEEHGLLPDGTWAYEVDGLGGALAADDANLPSLLGLPLVADVAPDDPRYLATRERILSPANPWWHSGSAASGIGSPHTAGRRVWPIALAVQGLTSPDPDERLRLARLLAGTTAGTGRMHESFHADRPGDFTRGWFSWADMMFCELVQSLLD